MNVYFRCCSRVATQPVLQPRDRPKAVISALNVAKGAVIIATVLTS